MGWIGDHLEEKDAKSCSIREVEKDKTIIQKKKEYILFAERLARSLHRLMLDYVSWKSPILRQDVASRMEDRKHIDGIFISISTAGVVQ